MCGVIGIEGLLKFGLLFGRLQEGIDLLDSEFLAISRLWLLLRLETLSLGAPGAAFGALVLRGVALLVVFGPLLIL